MPPARMSRERAEQVVGAVNNAIKAGYQMGGMPSAIEAAARALNWPPYTVRDRLEATAGMVPEKRFLKPREEQVPRCAPAIRSRQFRIDP